MNRIAKLFVLIAGMGAASQAFAAREYVNENDPAYKSALGAVAIAIGCHRAFGDEDLISLAREMMIGALRNQEIRNIYQTADEIIATLKSQPLGKKHRTLFTAQQCENTKQGLMGALR